MVDLPLDGHCRTAGTDVTSLYSSGERVLLYFFKTDSVQVLNPLHTSHQREMVGCYTKKGGLLSFVVKM